VRGAGLARQMNRWLIASLAGSKPAWRRGDILAGLTVLAVLVQDVGQEGDIVRADGDAITVCPKINTAINASQRQALGPRWARTP